MEVNGTTWLTPKDVAERFKVTVRTVNRWIAKKQLPVCRIGKTRRFDSAALDRWFSKQH